MSERNKKLGIKQVIRIEWMNKTLDMMLAGMCSKEIRNELKLYLADKKQSGGIGSRGEKTYSMAIGILMKTWCNPDDEIKPLRDDALAIAKTLKINDRLPLHWSMISAAYPFWLTVAEQMGRLLKLQDMVTQSQIVKRLKEHYGDRQTISRNARYIIRSFVSWDVINDQKRGCYKKNTPYLVSDPNILLLLLESYLLGSKGMNKELRNLLNSPFFFPFSIHKIDSDHILNNASRISITQYNFNDIFVKLK